MGYLRVLTFILLVFVKNSYIGKYILGGGGYKQVFAKNSVLRQEQRRV